MNIASNLYKIIIISILLLAVNILCIDAKGQDINNKRGVEVSFVQKKTEHSPNELSSNILKIKNNSGREFSFRVNLSLPAGWQYVARKEKTYKISPYDSVFVPVNIAHKQAITGNVNNVINATLISDSGVQFASAIWYMNIKKVSDWSVSIIQNKVFFLNDSNSVKFALRINNNGNSEEHLKISFQSEKRLRVFHESALNQEIHFLNITIPINTDTLLYFKAERGLPIQKTFRNDFEVNEQLNHSDILPLKISVKNDSEDRNLSKSWRGSIDFIKSSSESKLRESASNTIPLTIEANVDNILDNSTILSLALYGNKEFENNRNLSYNFQTSFFNNFLSYRPFWGDSHYLGYFTPKSSIETGNINGFSNFGFTVTGVGVKATQEVFKNNTIGVFYLKDRFSFNTANKDDYGFLHRLTLGRNTIENSIQFNRNDYLQVNSTIYSNRIKLNFFRFHNLILNSSVSKEDYSIDENTISKRGFAYAINYSGGFKKFTIGLSTSLGTAFNTSYRGIKSLGGDVSYRLNPFNSFTATYYSFSQKPEYFSQAGALLNFRRTGSERLELKHNYNTGLHSFTSRYQYLYNDIFNIRSQSNGLGFDYRPAANGDFRFFFSVLGAYVKLLDYNLDPYFSSQVRTTLRMKNLTSNIRYFYGPYQSFEQILFAKSKINNQSIYTNTNLKFWLIKNTLTLEPNVNYSYETLYKRDRISIRPEVYYIPKNGLEFKFYAQYLNNTQRENPLINLDLIDNTDRLMQYSTSSNYFFGFGVKRRLGVPVSRKKYYKLKVSVYKDLNGNNKQDKNESGLRNVLVNIKSLELDSVALTNFGFKDVGESFVTDEEGNILYKNLPKGRYRVSIIPLSETNGFFAGSEQNIIVDNDTQVYMNLNQGVQLTGNLMINRDVNAVDFDKMPDISNIRITAMDEAGKTFNTLTDHNGMFSLRVPVGVYRISINEKALPENFELEENSIVLEMTSVANNYNIAFIANEKKKKLNIKKFDQKGNEIKEKKKSTKE